MGHRAINVKLADHEGKPFPQQCGVSINREGRSNQHEHEQQGSLAISLWRRIVLQGNPHWNIIIVLCRP